MFLKGKTLLLNCVAILVAQSVFTSMSSGPDISGNTLIPQKFVHEDPMPEPPLQETVQLLVKRVGRDLTLENMLKTLVTKLRRLDLEYMVYQDYFDTIIEQSVEKEKHYPLGVMHNVFMVGDRMRSNVGIVAKDRNKQLRSSDRDAGEIFATSFNKRSNDANLVSLIRGHSALLPDTEDTCQLINFLCSSIAQFFEEQSEENTGPLEVIEKSWSQAQIDNVGNGCITMTLAIITADNVIKIANIGNGWVGLYRDEEFIRESTLSMYSEGAEFQMCIQREGSTLEYANAFEDAQHYTWRAQEGDLLIMVSDSVRKYLEPENILEAFGTIKRLGPVAAPFMEDADLDLIGMDIVKAASYASGKKVTEDMLALVVQVQGHN